MRRVENAFNGNARGKAMKTLPAAGPGSQLGDDQSVPDDLIGRLYRASESTVFDLLPELSLQDRAYLAMFCYRKSHLHRIGLAIAATCDEGVLVQTWGTALGQTLYAQSREAPPAPQRLPGAPARPRPPAPRRGGPPPPPPPLPGQHRAKITLATLGAAPWVAADED